MDLRYLDKVQYMLIIRKAIREDSEAIAMHILLAMEEIVYKFIGENDYTKAKELLVYLVKEVDNQYGYQHCWVGELEGEIVAAAVVYDGAKLADLRAPVAQYIRSRFGRDFNPEEETEAGEYYIDSLGVSPGRQGKGIGSAMLRFLIGEYVGRQQQTLGLLVDKENPDAKKLYLKLGFRVVGERMLVGKPMEHLQIGE